MYCAWPVLLSSQKAQLCGYSGGYPALRKSGVLEQDSRISMNSRLAWAQQWHLSPSRSPKEYSCGLGMIVYILMTKLGSVRYKDGKFKVRLHSTGTSWPLRYISSLHTTNSLITNSHLCSEWSILWRCLFTHFHFDFAYNIHIIMNFLT